MRRELARWRIDPALLAEVRKVCAEKGLRPSRVVEALLRYFLRIGGKLG